MRIPHTLIRWLGALSLAAATAVIVTACGGGGDGGSSASGGGGTSSGGGGTSSGGSGTSSGGGGTSSGGGTTVANTAVITVDSGLSGSNLPNIPTVSVTVCAPGTSTCQVVDHVLVDTGSFGLRLVGAAMSNLLGSLPVTTVGGAPLAECGSFVSSYTWGTVRTVDLKINGEQANTLPVQIIGDLGTTNVPSTCTNGGTSANSSTVLGANGILGIGPKPYDCGPSCVTSSSGARYYSCPNGNSSCTPTTVPLAQQIANPVQRFATNNNGVIVQMPAISNGGQASATGMLIFGIGTQSNNALAASTVLPSTTTGDIGGVFLGKSVTAFFDTGSNAYFFDDPAQTKCSNGSFYCPPSTVGYSATLTGQNGTRGTVSFSVANADALFSNRTAFAFNDLAGPFDGTGKWLDLGLSHFYGKSIYFGMDLTMNGGAAPYVAF